MNDALTHFIANNLFLTLILLYVIFKGLRTGFGPARTLVPLIVLAIVASTLVRSCGYYVIPQGAGPSPGVATALPSGASGSGAPPTTSGGSLAQCRPNSTWTAADQSPEPSGLHGPYASVDDAVRRDRASGLAYEFTRLNPIEAEYGFLIVRDRRPNGGYYTTPPIAAPVKTGATDRPQFRIEDYSASEDKAFGSCDYHKYFIPVATVHTHPNVWWYPSNSFSADDFDQAVQLKQMNPDAWEEIVMINAYDQKIRTFTPQVNDQVIGSLLGGYYISWVGMVPYTDVNWSVYAALRVKVIGQFVAKAP